LKSLGGLLSKYAKDIDVSVTTVRRWIKEYGTKGDLAFPGKGNLHPADEETRRMKKRIKDLEEKNAILKEAMAIFAKDGK
jgi:transposase